MRMPDHDGLTRDEYASPFARRLRLHSGPETTLLESATCLHIPSIFRTRFLLHQSDILLERQGCPMESLDRELLDARGAMPDIKLLAGRLPHTAHALTCHLSTDVVLPVIDTHASIGLHGAGKDLVMHTLQPAVRINQCWHSRQRRELLTGHTRRLVATGARLVGALVVVMGQKGLGGLLNLFAGPWQMDEQALLAERAMKSLYIGVLVWTMRRDHIGLHPKTQQEAQQCRGEVAPGRAADKTRIVIKGEQSRQTMLAQKLGHDLQEGLGIEIGPDFSMKPNEDAGIDAR
jgi:hypothetical protein